MRSKFSEHEVASSQYGPQYRNDLLVGDANMNFKMELKAQLGSCRPLSANKLHLLSKVGSSREIASKNRLSLLKYDSFVYGDLIEYSNSIYGLASVTFPSSNCVISIYITYRVQLENY